jgi:putative membrane protein
MMKLLGEIIMHLVGNAIAILIAREFVDGVSFVGDLIGIVTAAGVLTVIQFIVRPILKLFFGPLILLSFGLFILVINALTLYFLDFLSPELTIQGYWSLLLTTLIVSLVNLALGKAGRWAGRE